MRRRPADPLAAGGRCAARLAGTVALLVALFVPASPAHAAMEDLLVAPSSGPPGTQLTISGLCTDFINLGATVSGPPIIPLVSLAVSLSGTWSTTVTVPAEAPAGPVEITAACTPNLASTDTVTFTVTPATAPTTTTPPTPTTPPPTTPPAGTPTTTNPSNPSNPGAPGAPPDDGGGTDDDPASPSQPTPGSPTSAPAGGSSGGGSGGNGGDGGDADTDSPAADGDDDADVLDSDAAVAVRASDLRDAALSAGGDESGGGLGWLSWLLVGLLVGAAAGVAVWFGLVKRDDTEFAEADRA